MRHPTGEYNTLTYSQLRAHVQQVPMCNITPNHNRLETKSKPTAYAVAMTHSYYYKSSTPTPPGKTKENGCHETRGCLLFVYCFERVLNHAFIRGKYAVQRNLAFYTTLHS